MWVTESLHVRVPGDLYSCFPDHVHNHMLLTVPPWVTYRWVTSVICYWHGSLHVRTSGDLYRCFPDHVRAHMLPSMTSFNSLSDINNSCIDVMSIFSLEISGIYCIFRASWMTYDRCDVGLTIKHALRSHSGEKAKLGMTVYGWGKRHFKLASLTDHITLGLWYNDISLSVISCRPIAFISALFLCLHVSFNFSTL
jgi:hypothetical protein